MLLTVGLYTLATAAGVHPVTAVIALGVAILAATLALSRRLPAIEAGQSEKVKPFI
jgi:hypothetical protein